MAAPRDYLDRTVFVTGAAGGLGSALCRRFAAATARAAWWLRRLAPRSYEPLMLARVGAEFHPSRRSPA
jgi:NAD(P)-dependent dehydrogenase (short-subunit alcohol dehydrogenase family)